MRRIRRFLILTVLAWAWRNRQMLLSMIRRRSLAAEPQPSVAAPVE